MKTILYIFAAIMVIGWIIGFVGYAIGGLIHLLLLIAIVSILYNLLARPASSI
ncbi:MAG: lmo0937 family membrane protein [Balneolales bacterium]|nr:lmo0937 family membrane protein [Balneolales bacterium]